VAAALGTAADLLRDRDRCCSACSVVVAPLRGLEPPSLAGGSFGPMTRVETSLAHRLGIQAADALDRAGKMPPGRGRLEAMQKATILQNASDMMEHFSRKIGVPAE
jgi:hypothetical protein